MTAKKKGAKTAARSPAPKMPEKVPQSHGGALLSGGVPGNTGGKKGRSGRKPDAFREMCQSLASSAETEEQVEKILTNKDHPAFIGALKWATENGFGKLPEKLDVAVVDLPAEQRQARVLSILQAAKARKQG